MPLNLAALTSGLPGAGNADYPETVEACARAWASAVDAWAAGVVPLSSTVASAAAMLEQQLTVAFLAGSLPAVDAAFQLFAVDVALGMAPLYTGVAPAAGPGLAELLSSARPASRQEGVALVAQALDAWLRTGTAVLIAPPNTALPAWS